MDVIYSISSLKFVISEDFFFPSKLLLFFSKVLRRIQSRELEGDQWHIFWVLGERKLKCRILFKTPISVHLWTPYSFLCLHFLGQGLFGSDT